MDNELPKKRRPYGECYSKAIRVRFPPEVDKALREFRRLFGVSLAQVVREGVFIGLEERARAAMTLAESPDTSGSLKLRIVQFIRAYREAKISIALPEVAESLRESAKARLNERRRSRRRTNPHRSRPRLLMRGGSALDLLAQAARAASPVAPDSTTQ